MILFGEHWFESASSIQAKLGPIVVRADGIKDERKAKQYVAQVIGLLRALEATYKTGKAVMTAIRMRNRPVLIFPYDFQAGKNNAWAKRTWGMFTATVSFTPLVISAASRCSEDECDNAPPSAPFQVMLHELVHVARAVAGQLPMFSLDDAEEEMAVMVTNMLSEESGRDLMTDYYVGNPVAVTSDLAAFSREYFEDNADMIGRFCRETKDLALRLAQVPTKFNPPRQFLNTTASKPRSGR